MNRKQLQRAVTEIKEALETSIASAQFNGKAYDDGQKAKEALIRSQGLILKVHEVAKTSLVDVVLHEGRNCTVFPPIGTSAPELPITGLIKSKNQDIVLLFNGDAPKDEMIEDGPLKGHVDKVGREQSERSVVVGIRSQLSSVAKNFDTLMERAFAETLNLRLRLPRLVMGEVYLLPIVEYDDQLMKANKVGFKTGYVPVEKFIRTFSAISGRAADAVDEDFYKYERSALVLVDFREDPPHVFASTQELRDAGAIGRDTLVAYEPLAPDRFARDILSVHDARHR